MIRNPGPASLFVALMALASGSALGVEDRRPNVILILADHLGSGEVSCSGPDSAPTPHLDRMAAEGVRFTCESPEPHPDLIDRDWIWSAVDPVKRWERTRWMVNRAPGIPRGTSGSAVLRGPLAE